MRSANRYSAQGGRGQTFTALLAAVLFALFSATAAQAALVNTVKATATYGGSTLSATSTKSLAVAPANPLITVTKTGTVNDGGDGVANVGDTISYSFTVKNDGNVTLTNISITDILTTVSGGPIASMAPGASDATTFTATYTLTQADIDAGQVVNKATATATAATGGTATGTADVTTPLTSGAGLTLAKSGTLNDGGDGIADVGDTITYSFTVTNTGATTLSNVKVSDPKLDFAYYQQHGPQLALAAADTMATGSIDTVSRGGDVTAPNVAAVTTDVTHTLKALPPVAEGLVVKRTAYLLAAGQAITGTPVQIVYSVTNTGDVPLTGIRLWTPGAEAAITRDLLQPGETDNLTFASTRSLSAVEAERGVLLDNAVISAAARGHRLVAADRSAQSLDLLASADDMITAAITPASVATVPPGGTASFSATYTLTQADIDAGFVDNTASATGNDPFGNTITAPASAHVVVPAAPAIAIVKTSTLDLGSDNTASLGDIVTYHFTVTNTGNVSLSNISVTDPKATVSGGPLATLAPAATDATTFTATYALTQADLDAGQVQNQATATGTAPDGTKASDLSDNASETGNNPTITSLSPAASIALVKKAGTVADTNGNGITDVGDTLAYTLEVTNTGNVTLSQVTVTDGNATVAGGPLASLAPGTTDATTFTATHILTQADLDAGQVSNQATATGKAPDASTVTDLSDDLDVTQDDATVFALAEAPGIALVKTVSSITDSNGNGLHDTGDVIHYAFAVTNTGNVTLSNVTVSDPLGTVTGGPVAALAPGQTDTTTFAMDYTVTAADLIAGSVINQATTTGTSPKATPVQDLSDDNATTENDKTVTTLDEVPGIALIKVASGITDTNANGISDVGDVIHYTFSVTNTGNAVLTNVIVTDPLAVVTGGPLGSLAVGQTDSTTFKASYVLTAADVAAGKVTNQALASGTSTLGATVSDKSDDALTTEDDPTVTPLAAAPGVSLLKSVSSITDTNANGISDVGDVIHYAFSVTNTGNVVLNNVVVTDPLVTVAGGPLATLAIGATDGATFTAAYTITQKDVNAGRIVNQATVTAKTPAGATVSDLSDSTSEDENDPTITPLSSKPGIALVKTVAKVVDRNGDGLTNAGDSIIYAFAITNTGNVTLTNISVSDVLVAVKGGPLAKLEPGQKDTKTFSATYTVTVADEATGKVVNQATATGRTPTGAAVSDKSDDTSIKGNNPTVTPISRSKPTLSKTALTSQVHRGEQVAFEIVATKVTFDPARIDDIVPPGFTFLAGSATANGTAVKPAVNGRRLTFTGLHPDAKGMIKLRLRLVATAAVVPGNFVNNAELYNATMPVVVAQAKAPFTVTEDATFDCGEIIGKVFDDRNQSGYQDQGEPGIPAVRLATVNGLLITTDKDGRYHIPCAMLPDAEIGSNFVLKLDTRTLPTGYSLTTENPRDVRLTRGKIAKLNFGAAIHRVVKLDLMDAAFVAGKAELKPQWASALTKLYKQLDVAPSLLRVTYNVGAEGQALAKARLAAVKAMILKGWKDHRGAYDLKIDSRLTGLN